MKDLFRVNTRTIVAIGLGAAIFTLLFMYVKVPSPIPEMRISAKAHSLNGGCRTVFERRKLTEKFYIKCATSGAAI